MRCSFFALILALASIPASAQVVEVENGTAVPERAPDAAQTALDPHGQPLSPEASTALVQVRTRLSEESLELVTGFDTRWSEGGDIVLGDQRIHIGPTRTMVPRLQHLCTGDCLLPLLVGGTYQFYVRAAPEDARRESNRFPQLAEPVTITERTIGLEVTFDPRRERRRRRWLIWASVWALGGVLMAAPVAGEGSVTDSPVFWTGFGLAVFTPCFISIPIVSFGRAVVTPIEADQSSL